MTSHVLTILWKHKSSNAFSDDLSYKPKLLDHNISIDTQYI